MVESGGIGYTAIMDWLKSIFSLFLISLLRTVPTTHFRHCPLPPEYY